MSIHEQKIAILLPHALKNLRNGVDPEALWAYYEKDWGKRYAKSLMARALKVLETEGF